MIPFRAATEVSLAGKGGAGSVELYGLADSSSALPSSDEKYSILATASLHVSATSGTASEQPLLRAAITDASGLPMAPRASPAS